MRGALRVVGLSFVAVLALSGRLSIQGVSEGSEQQTLIAEVGKWYELLGTQGAVQVQVYYSAGRPALQAYNVRDRVRIYTDWLVIGQTNVFLITTPTGDVCTYTCTPTKISATSATLILRALPVVLKQETVDAKIGDWVGVPWAEGRFLYAVAYDRGGQPFFALWDTDKGDQIYTKYVTQGMRYGFVVGLSESDSVVYLYTPTHLAPNGVTVSFMLVGPATRSQEMALWDLLGPSSGTTDRDGRFCVKVGLPFLEEVRGRLMGLGGIPLSGLAVEVYLAPRPDVTGLSGIGTINGVWIVADGYLPMLTGDFSVSGALVEGLGTVPVFDIGEKVIAGGDGDCDPCQKATVSECPPGEACSPEGQRCLTGMVKFSPTQATVWITVCRKGVWEKAARCTIPVHESGWTDRQTTAPFCNLVLESRTEQETCDGVTYTLQHVMLYHADGQKWVCTGTGACWTVRKTGRRRIKTNVGCYVLEVGDEGTHTLWFVETPEKWLAIGLWWVKVEEEPPEETPPEEAPPKIPGFGQRFVDWETL